jgi:hypothetical protein
MRAPTFTLLVVAAVLIGGAAWFLQEREEGSWREQALPPGASVLGDFDVNEVSSVRLRGPGGAVTLRRGERGWVVAERGDYPASFELVSGLVRGLADLRALQSVPVAPEDLGALVLRAPEDGAPADETGVLIELLASGDRSLGSVVLGKLHEGAITGQGMEFGGPSGGRYVRPGGASGEAYLVSESFPDVGFRPAGWIRREFPGTGPLTRIEVKSSGKDRSWVIERDAPGSAWRMVGLRKNQTLDGTKLANIDALLGGLSVADAAEGPADPRLAPLTMAPLVVVADSAEGLRYTFTLGEGGADELPVKMAVEQLPAAAPTQAPASGAAGASAEKLAKAAAFAETPVFIPRRFFEPFLVPRASLIVETKSAPASPGKAKR